MAAKSIPTLDVRTRDKWRAWLRKNHRTVSEVWLVFHKRQTNVKSLPYEDAVEEALCFGWIDSLVRRLDDERYARKFTPRTAESRWSALNRKRYASLAERGLLEPAGRERAPTGSKAPTSSGYRVPAALPQYLETALKAEPRAWEFFTTLAPSYRRAYIAWIDSAKKEDTKARRLNEAVRALAKGRKLGLK